MRLLLILLSIISCQSMNETSTSHFLPFQGLGGNNNSFGGASSRSRVVETKYGKVQGISLTLFPGPHHGSGKGHPIRNRVVEVFLNIPYASPPVKSHRFSPTQTPHPWEGIRSAVKPGFVCPQMMPDIRNETAALKEMPKGYLEYLRRVEPYLRNQSEDCLYLNIYSPIGPDPRLKPVLVFVHGGRFAWGSGNLSDGTVLSAYSDVIFVSLNYRLGVLGFLNANASPGSKPRVANYGLMDQIAALHWIKENIVFFGGDPENITLMGYEAGAACIHFLMSSPAVMPGLFHRSILIAGSSAAPWALVSDPAAVAIALAESLNCSLSSGSSGTNGSSVLGPQPTTSPGQKEGHHHKSSSASFSSTTSDPVLDCLKNKHFTYFTRFAPPKFSVDFGPSIDGIVIKSNFRASWEGNAGKRDVFKKYDILFGLSSLEKLTAFSEADLTFGFEAARRDAILRTLIRNSYRYHLNEILATITNEYIDWEKAVQHPVSTRDLTVNAVTDALSLAPLIAASESVHGNKAFFYVFEHATKEGLYNYQRSGAGGGEELNYIFGLPLIEAVTGQVLPFVPTPIPANYTKTEMALSELLITFLSNFIHTGDPNEPLKSEGNWPISKERNRFKNTGWEPYERVHQKYLEISANKIRTRSHYRAHQMAIWLRLVPELQRTGAFYSSNIHNRMKGGSDPSLYVGSPRLSQEEDPSIGSNYEIDLDLNGEPPIPPTTCISPLSPQEASSSGATGEVRQNDTSLEPSYFSPYSTALSFTIAIGCSLLILNVFIFALVYYQRDKKRAGVERGKEQAEGSSGGKYNEPPELLKNSSNAGTSTHADGGPPNPGIHHCQAHGHSQGTGHRGILLSPPQQHSTHHQHMAQVLGVATLPRSNGGVNVVLSTLPKPPPPPRNFANFSTLPHKSSQNYTPYDELKV